MSNLHSKKKHEDCRGSEFCYCPPGVQGPPGIAGPMGSQGEAGHTGPAGPGISTDFTSFISTNCAGRQVNVFEPLPLNVNDVDIVINTRGLGALMVDVPDFTATGGNCRGAYSVDLQSSRNLNTQVASAINSVISGGDRNTASGENSVVAGGFLNTSSGLYSVTSGGNRNNAAGNSSFIGGGINNGAFGPNSIIAGGENNQTLNVYAVVSGGFNNKSSGALATVAGGSANISSGVNSTVSGGFVNVASANGAAIGGGDNNQATGKLSTIGGGTFNKATAEQSTVSGGERNVASEIYTVVSGGLRNQATNINAIVAGGRDNLSSGINAVVGGGERNISSGDGAVISGGRGNASVGINSVVSGGENNTVSDFGSVIGGGRSNKTIDTDSVIAGGAFNTVFDVGGAILGGRDHQCSGVDTTIGGGRRNQTFGTESAISGGSNNYSEGNDSVIAGGTFNTAIGVASTIAGGSSNKADGDYSGTLAGQGLSVTFPHSVAVGRYNDPGILEGSERVFMVGYGNDVNNPANVFSVTVQGDTYVAGTVYSNGGADFGEFYESADGCPIANGTTVTFSDNSRKIKVAESGDIPFGVISNTVSFIGNAAAEHWQGMYEKNSDGSFILETYEETEEVPITTQKEIIMKKEVVDYTKSPPRMKIIEEKKMIEAPETINVIIVNEKDEEIGRKDIVRTKSIVKNLSRRKISDKYDSTKLYVARDARPEWRVVGLLGVVKILKDCPVNLNWIKIETRDDYDLWFIH